MNNTKLIEEYEVFRKQAEDLTEQTVKIQTHYLNMFAVNLNKPFKQTSENDILNFLNTGNRDNTPFKKSTQGLLIGILKKFMCWINNYDLDDPIYDKSNLPGCVKRIKQKNGDVDDIKYRERVISLDEFQRMIDTTPNIMHRAIIETLYRFGPRISELLSMNSEGAEYDGNITRITVRESKTKTRVVPYKGRANFLMQYAESYQSYRGQKGKPFWVSIRGNRMDRRVVLGMIKRFALRAGIERNITNHDFRHTAITNDRSSGVPITHIETKFGLVHGSLMMTRYDHNKSKDYEDWLNKKREETEPTYDTLKKQHNIVTDRQQKEIDDLKNQLEKKTEIDNFVMDSLSLIAKEMIQNQGIESIKEIFRKHNVPLAKD